jgi:hypothetical protein
MVLGIIVRGYMRGLGDTIAIEVRESDIWGSIRIPRDTKATGLAISTPHGCVIVIGVDVMINSERVLVASFLDPLDSSTPGYIERISSTRRIAIACDGRTIGVLNLSEEDMGRVEYVASKTKECSQMQNRPVDLELAAQWFLENFSL